MLFLELQISNYLATWITMADVKYCSIRISFSNNKTVLCSLNLTSPRFGHSVSESAAHFVHVK